MCCSSYLFLYFKNAPLSYYLYFTFPIYFWIQIISQSRAMWSVLCSSLMSWRTLTIGVAYLVGLESLVLSYFHREILSLFFVGFAFWPFFESCEKRKNMSRGLMSAWLVGNLSLAIFPLLSVEMERNPLFLQVGTFWLVSFFHACSVEAWVWQSYC